MDIITHAVVGACTGAPLGHPVLGAIAAVVPDVVLGLKRRAEPTLLYDFTHSLEFTAIAALWFSMFSGSLAVTLTVLMSLLSHLFLDAMTHGKQWAPPLLIPFTMYRFSFGKEWEWFNGSWWLGILWSINWIVAWALIAPTNL